jgi:RNA polymerase sigma-70 factor (ECF subfamily)
MMAIECEFINIYNEYYSKIIQYLSIIVGPNDAEDLAQDVFNKLCRILGGFKGKSKLSTWIYRIATNVAIDRSRSASYKQASVNIPLEDTSGFGIENAGGPSGPSAVDQVVIRKEMRECIIEYIDKLSLNYRLVLVLSEMKGLSNQEIADILEISVDNVKIRLHRARAKLKVVLNEGCDFYYNEQNTLACDRKQVQILRKAPK